MTGKPARAYGRNLRVNMVVRLHEDAHEKVRRLASLCGKSISDWVRHLIEREIIHAEKDQDR